MKFGNEKYTYVSKKKVEKLKGIRTQKAENNLLMTIKEEKEKDPGDVVRGRVEIQSDGLKLARSRSNSLTKNDCKELDCQWSDDEYEEQDKDKLDKDSFPIPQKKQPKVMYDLSQNNPQVVFEHEVDTNVLSIKFEFLKEKVEFATGDPHSCTQCNAVLNNISQLSSVDNSIDTYDWSCEFCGNHNILSLEKEEIPQTNCVDYFVQSINQISSTMKGINFDDNQSVIFCFDISGSMCVSSPIVGKHKFKGCTLERNMKDLLAFGDGSDQHFEQSHNVTYISRLQCLQAAIENNLTAMIKSAPGRKVGFVAFNNEVIGYGDGTKSPVKISGNNLNDFSMIEQIAIQNRDIIKTSLQDSNQYLLKQLYSIEESGQTALGPAVLFAISLIDDLAPGSRIILCTDGISNMGLGGMEDVKDQQQLEELKDFYTKLGKIAKDKGVVINLITFEDAESKIEILVSMIEQTGGEILRVKPTEILEQFGNLLATEIVATNVLLKIKLHKALTFRKENPDHVKAIGNAQTLIKEVGNVTKDSEMYIEYCFKTTDELAKFEDIDLETINTVPFQSIIEYTNPNGDKCIRVITETQQLSSEKEEVESCSKFDIISPNVIRRTAQLAQEGKYREAQSNALAWKKMIKSKAQISQNAYDNYQIINQNLAGLNQELQEIQYTELVSMPAQERSAPTSSAMNDRLSQKVYQLKKASQENTQQKYLEKLQKKK